MKGQRQRSMLSGIAIPIVIALLLAACGGGGDTNAGSGDDQVTTTTEADETTDTTEATEVTTTTEGTSETTIAETGTTLPGGSPTTTAQRSTTTARTTGTTARRGTTTTAKPSGPTTTVTPRSSIPAHPEQGVTANSIKIGAVASVVNNVDSAEIYKMLISKWKTEGLLPIHGRNIQMVTYTLRAGDQNVISASQRAACVQQSTLDKVFFSMGTSSGSAGVCMSTEYKVPFLGAAGVIPTDAEMATASPFLFFNNMTSSRGLRNWPYWAKDRGYLSANPKIGSFIPDDPTFRADFNDNFKPSLAKIGASVGTETVYRDAASVPAAVQRLKSAGVDVVFVGSNAGFPAFAQELDKQNFKPDVLMTDWDSSAITGSGGAGVGRDLPDSFRGAAMTYYARAEDGSSSNPALSKNAQGCLDDVAKYTGRRLVYSANGKPTADTSVGSIAMHICDQGKILMDALRAAGPDLTTESLIAALEKTDLDADETHGQVGTISFTPKRHAGADQLKTIIWDYQCDCWKYSGGFRAAWAA